jgi:putative transposase
MPEPFAFEPGVEYVLKGVGYRVLKLLSEDQVLVKNLMTKGEKAEKIGDLRKEWHEYHLAFGLHGRNLREEEGCIVKTSYEFGDLDFLDHDLAQEAWDRYQLILPLLELHPVERTDDHIKERIKEFMAGQILLMACGKRMGTVFPLHTGKRWKEEHLGEDSIDFSHLALEEELERIEHSASDILTNIPLLRVSARTVRRWIESFEESREDIRSLVPAYNHRGRHVEPLSTKVSELLERAIKEVYETEERPPVTKVIAKLEFLILQENEKCPDGQPKLVVPGKSKVYRTINQLDSLEVDTARLGKRYAQRKHQQYHRGPRPTRPNRRWEEDDTVLDLFVIDEVDGLPIGRPLLTAVRDKYCGVIPGFSVSFEPSSARTVMECLFYAIPEKDYVKSLFDLRNDYVGYGIPEVLVVDRGPGYIGKDLKLACAQLGIELDPLPGRSPWLKASIERYFKTVNTDLFHATPGTSFSNFLERGDYDPAKHACITLNGLWYILHKWAVDVYTREAHRGVGGVPAKLWERALNRDFVPRLPASRNELAILLSRVESRVIQSTGIEFENLWYQDSRLSKLRDLLNSSKPRIPAQFKYNPSDLSRIWVMDPNKKEYLEVLAEDQEYTRELSIWKHLVIKRYVREEMNRDVDEKSLILAKEELYQAIHKEFRQGNRLGGRKRAARFLDIQVSEALRRANSSQADVTETPTISQLINFEGSTTELGELTVRSLPGEQAEKAQTLSVGDGIAQSDVPLPPMVEGVTLPGGEENVEAGARLPEQENGIPKQNTSKEDSNTSKTNKTLQVSTDPDEDTSFGIAVGYGRRGPT